MTSGTNTKPQFPTINLFAKDKKVGTLIFEQPRVCRFEYDAHWLQSGYPISPNIPFFDSVEPTAIINFIRNLFPEGSAFETLLETEQLSKNNLYGILNTIGQDTAGVLTFSDPVSKQSSEQQTNPLRLIQKHELIERLNSNDPSRLTNWDGKYRLSVAGVQNKLNVFIDKDSSIYLAGGNYASTHILKFTSEHHPSLIANELFCMRLAKSLGIDVATVNHASFGQHKSLVVKRFDRRITDDGVDKRHIIDACQALNLPPEYKYEQNYGSGIDVAHIRDGVSLKKLFNFAQHCSVPGMATQKLLDWLIFNLIIGNSDAHGKNVSFYIQPNGITLTPFYDLVSVVYESKNNDKLDTHLAMAIGDNFDIDQITAFDLLSIAEETGIKFDLLKRRIDRITNSCLRQINQLDFGNDNLSEKQQADITNLTELVIQRCAYFQEQSQQFRTVIKEAF